jgi:hypothetical protein
MELFDAAIINRFCDQGAGFDLSVCGYTTQQSVLLQLFHIPYIEVYRRLAPESFLNNQISFSHKVCQVSLFETPFLQHLSLFDGCSHSKLEILWKYYCAVEHN